MQRRMMLAGYQAPAPPTYLVPTWRGGHSATSGTTTASSLSCSLATAAAQAGDVAVAWAGFNGSSLTPTISGTGWNPYFTQNLSTTFSGRAFWKVLTASDITANTVTISVTTAQRSAMGLAVWYNTTGVANAQVASDINNDTSQPVAALTVVSAKARPFFVMAANFAAGGTSFTSPVEYQERLEAVSTHTSNRRAGVTCADDSGGNRDLGYVKAAAAVTTNVLAHSASFSGELVAAVV